MNEHEMNDALHYQFFSHHCNNVENFEDEVTKILGWGSDIFEEDRDMKTSGEGVRRVEELNQNLGNPSPPSIVNDQSLGSIFR